VSIFFGYAVLWFLAGTATWVIIEFAAAKWGDDIDKTRFARVNRPLIIIFWPFFLLATLYFYVVGQDG